MPKQILGPLKYISARFLDYLFIPVEFEVSVEVASASDLVESDGTFSRSAVCDLVVVPHVKFTHIFGAVTIATCRMKEIMIKKTIDDNS